MLHTASLNPPYLLFQVNKEEDDKMRTTAANVAVRAATGVGDITSRWQLMIEAKQKQGGSDTSSAPQTTNKDVGRKPPLTTSTRENQESEKQDSSVALTTPGKLVVKGALATIDRDLLSYFFLYTQLHQ